MTIYKSTTNATTKSTDVALVFIKYNETENNYIEVIMLLIDSYVKFSANSDYVNTKILIWCANCETMNFYCKHCAIVNILVIDLSFNK